MKSFVSMVVTGLVLLLTASASAASYYVPHGHRACRAGYTRHVVSVRERRHGRLVRRRHRIVWVKQARCVKTRSVVHRPSPTPAPVLSAPAPAPVNAAPPSTTTTAPAPTPETVRADIDPSFTQDATDNLRVTWTYSAGTSGSLPPGTLSLQVTQPNGVGASGGCVMNVGGTVTGGACTQELPSYGAWNVTVSYTGASTLVAPATSTETDTIEPLPLTIAKTWGTDDPTSNPTVSATVIGQTANITATDSNYEGASSLPVSDDLGDSCTATISGSTASCHMPVTGTPIHFTLSYPGGTSTHSTRAVNPGGTQHVTTTWPAQSVAVSNPTVTVQQATVQECGSHVPGINNDYATCSYQSPSPWPSTITIGTMTHFQLFAKAYGSLASDRDPTYGGGYVDGYLTYNVTGPATDYTLTSQQGSTPNGSTDCSRVENQTYLGGDAGNPANYGPDEPSGGCDFVFPTAGQYTITVSYHSEDPNYADVRNDDQVTINVQ